MTIKEEFIEFYNQYLMFRSGAIDFLEYLKGTDFFEAPASTKFHSCVEGGLAEHSLKVAKLMMEKNSRFSLGERADSIAICGLLHDVCKTGFYKKSDETATAPQRKYLETLAGGSVANNDLLTKGHASNLIEWYKNGQQGEEPRWKQEYVVDEQLPLGHGEKSIYLINRYMGLSDDEAMAIRWHLGMFDAGIHFSYPSGFPFNKALHSCKLLTIMMTADLESSNLLES